MSKYDNFVMSSWEAEKFIENLNTNALEDIGTESWFEYHKTLMLLSQQCILEINSLGEESIKENFITFQKISVLVSEAVQINIWKKNVLPHLIRLNEEPSNTFLLYSVLYHEELAVSLIENILFHSESAVSLNDTVIDLIDYAAVNLTNLLYAKINEANEYKSSSNSCLEDLKQKKEDIGDDIQFKCVSILRYLAEFIDYLPLCAVSRMLCTHDIPYLLAQVIEKKPWKKVVNGQTLVYNGKWEPIITTDEDKILKIEAQVWIGLREFLLNPTCAPYYKITQFRKSQFLKLQKYLLENILDQIPPLIELRKWLSYIDVSQQSSNNQCPITVEILPEIKTSILKKYTGRWKKLAKYQSQFFFTNDINAVKKRAQILSDAYDIDKIELSSVKTCSFCNKHAMKRCSNCKITWYCQRECQVKHWISHKEVCAKLGVGQREELKV